MPLESCLALQGRLAATSSTRHPSIPLHVPASSVESGASGSFGGGDDNDPTHRRPPKFESRVSCAECALAQLARAAGAQGARASVRSS